MRAKRNIVQKIEDSDIKAAIVRVINRFNEEDANTYLTLMKATLCGALKLNGAKEEEDLLLRRVEALNKKMLEIVNESVENGEDIESREDEFKNISDKISRLNERISAIRKAAGQDVNARGRMEFIEKQLAKMKCMITEYYDFAETVVRQMLECVKVFDSGKVEVVFEGGYVVEEQV